MDHVKALINGGENRESNLAPAHDKCHVIKTSQDVAEKAKVAAKRAKHIGAVRPQGKIQSPGFHPGKARSPKQAHPPKQLYVTTNERTAP